MEPRKNFTRDIILLDNIEAIVNSIVEKLHKDVLHNLKRFGAVVGISGGIDSAVCMALAARAFGSGKVLGMMLPEKDSNPESELLALELANKFRVEVIKEDLTQILSGFGCYERRDEAVRRVFPDFNSASYKMKIGIRQGNIYSNLPPVFYITIIDEQGIHQEHLLPVKEYLQIVAASNFKKRSRCLMLYYNAELRHYEVIGTPNKHEHNQGFFVKYGDGGADVMPIVNLYKTQVYQLARYLGVTEDIIERTPTTDTYTAEQTQEEFFYQMPFELMDIYWYAYENNYSAEEVGIEMGKSTEQVLSIFKNLERKRKTTEYLRMQPIINYFAI